jgi:uncharacterized BrkB/YihY/UPF0761 family membrane protein
MKQPGVADAPPPEPRGRVAARVAAVRAQGDRASEWARRHVPYAEIIADALERERLSAAGLLAGGLAYRLFFWVVPVGLVFASVLSFWVEGDRGGLEDAARRFGIGGAATSAATDALEAGTHSRWYLLAFGLVFMVWFGGGVVRALRIAYSVAWRLRPERLEHAARAGAIFSLVMLALFLLTASAAPVREATPGPGIGFTLALGVVYCAVVVWAMRLLPSKATDWRAFVPGAAMVAVGTVLIHVAVVIYLAPKLGRSSEVYGAFGSATVVLLWLYLEARLLVGAAFLNAALWERRQQPDSS